MKAHYRAFGGRLMLEVEGATIKDLFAQIGPIAEVLDADQKCGACESPSIYPRAREAQGFTFYELCCGHCGARLSFGQHKAGDTLFAKRNDERGNPLPGRGWAVYIPSGDRPSSTRPQQALPGKTDPPDLTAFLRRARSQEQEQDVLGELGDRVAQRVGEDEADRIWKEAVKDKPTTEALIRRLYAAWSKGKE